MLCYILFHSVLFCCLPLCYSVPFYSVMLRCSIVMFRYILLNLILSYSIPDRFISISSYSTGSIIVDAVLIYDTLCSILLCSTLFYPILSYCILFSE